MSRPKSRNGSDSAADASLAEKARAKALNTATWEQGRPQLGKPWGSAKKGTCEGFTIDEFSRLNLSVMDFSEVVAEFTDAAKLPDELATSTMIQQRIKDYYETRKP